MVKKLVMFDFDGVLANTLEASYAIHKEVNKGFSWQEFQDFSNGNFFSGIGKAVQDGLHKIPENFFNHYERAIAELNIHEILHQTVIDLAKSYTLSIVSSTDGKYIKKFLTQENLSNEFMDIMGTDVHTSKVVKIKMLLKRYEIQPQDAILITDTLGDILEAKECGVRSVGVLWGLHPQETLEKGEPAQIIENPADLFGAVKKLLR